METSTAQTNHDALWPIHVAQLAERYKHDCVQPELLLISMNGEGKPGRIPWPVSSSVYFSRYLPAYFMVKPTINK